jgi:hypothetical protein
MCGRRADPSPNVPALGKLAQADESVAANHEQSTAIRTHYLTVLPYNIMTNTTSRRYVLAGAALPVGIPKD